MYFNPSACIFDLDGLLLDSERVSRDCWIEAAKEFGQSVGEIYPSLIGKGLAGCDAILAEHFGDAVLVARMRNRKNELQRQVLERASIPLKPGARETLELAKKNGMQIALATGSVRDSVHEKLRPHDLTRHFHAMVCGDDVERGKPAPDIFLAAAARVAVKPEACVVFEDSCAGVEGALAAGMRVVMVPDLVAPLEEYVARGVVIISSLFEAHQMYLERADDGSPSVKTSQKL